MTDKSDITNQNNKKNSEKSDKKEDDILINEISSKLQDEEEDQGQKINFCKIENIEKTSFPEEENGKNQKKDDEKCLQINRNASTQYTTNLFKVSKVEIVPNINFIQCSANLHYNFEDLNKFSEKIPEIAEIEKRGYKKDQLKKKSCFNRIKLLIEKPNKFIYLFKSGKMIYSRAKSIKESRNACFKCANIIKRCGYNIELKEDDIKINNISGNILSKIFLNYLNFRINLKKYLQKLREYSKNNDIKIKNILDKFTLKKYCQKLKESPISYNEPDSFPGVELYYIKSKFFIRTFSSGKQFLEELKMKSKLMKNIKKFIHC